MGDRLKGLLAGLLIGVAGTLLVGHFTGDHEELPERIAGELGCSDGADGIHPSTAARAHRYFGPSDGFSWFAVTHAERILGINGCDTFSPATSYLEFGDGIEMEHVLATLNNFGAVCLVSHAVFEGKVLNGRPLLEELCSAVDGELKVLGRSASAHQPNLDP